jgi:hypothetical protein
MFPDSDHHQAAAYIERQTDNVDAWIAAHETRLAAREGSGPLKQAPRHASAHDEAGMDRLQPILNLYGITGQGKTILMRQLYERLRRDHAVALLEFGASARPHPETRRLRLSEVLDALHRSGFQGHVPNSVVGPDDVRRPTDQIDVVCALAVDRERAPLILLLDAVNQLRYWKWVQEMIIKPLVEGRRTLVICTSRSEVAWDFWEIRRLCQTHKLEPFSEAEVEAYLRRLRLGALERPFYELTRGYPIALRYAVEHFYDQEQPDGDAPDLPDSPTTPVELAITHGGPLRRIDIPILTRLLKSTAGIDVPGLPLLGALIARGLADSSRDPVRFTPALRAAAERWLRAGRLDLLRRIYESLAEIYRAYVLALPQTNYAWWAANEWLYFAALAAEQAWADAAAWEQQRAEILAHIPAAYGRRLAIAFFRDLELRKSLERVGWLEPVEQFMGDIYARDPHDEQAAVVLRDTQQAQYRRAILSTFIEDFPEDIRATFDNVIEQIAQDQDFNLFKLKEDLNRLYGEDPRYQHTAITRIIMYLANSGYVDYDQGTYRYQADELLRRLA